MPVLCSRIPRLFFWVLKETFQAKNLAKILRWIMHELGVRGLDLTPSLLGKWKIICLRNKNISPYIIAYLFVASESYVTFSWFIDKQKYIVYRLFCILYRIYLSKFFFYVDWNCFMKYIYITMCQSLISADIYQSLGFNLSILIFIQYSENFVSLVENEPICCHNSSIHRFFPIF